jgi:hypothetical protein
MFIILIISIPIEDFIDVLEICMHIACTLIKTKMNKKIVFEMITNLLETFFF